VALNFFRTNLPGSSIFRDLILLAPWNNFSAKSIAAKLASGKVPWIVTITFSKIFQFNITKAVLDESEMSNVRRYSEILHLTFHFCSLLRYNITDSIFVFLARNYKNIWQDLLDKQDNNLVYPSIILLNQQCKKFFIFLTYKSTAHIITLIIQYFSK